MSDPKRLLDDPETSALLRQDLQTAKDDKVAYDVAAGLAAFHLATKASVAATGAAGAPTAAGGAQAAAGGAQLSGGAAAAKTAAAGGAAAAKTLGGVAALTKVAVAVGVVAGSVAGVTLFSEDDAAPDRAPRVAPTMPAPAAPVAPAEARVAPQADAVAVEPPITADSAQRVEGGAAVAPTVARPRTVVGERVSAGELKLRQETRQLARIKQLMRTRPKRAVALADAGHRRFDNGLFYPEREGLAVLALAELGREREALRRGRRWLAQFADSPMRPRLEAALEGLAGSAPEDGSP